MVTAFLAWPQVIFAVQADSAPTNGLIGYWSFDEGTGNYAYDYSGNKNTGVLAGSPKPVWLNGVFGKALSFNGSTSYINAGNKASLQAFSDITISSWVKFNGIDYVSSTGKLVTVLIKGNPDSLASSTGFWLSYDNRSNGRGFGYTCFGNTAGGYAGGGNNFAGYTYTFSNNVWYYITVTVASSQAKLYVNGVQLGATKTFSNLALSNVSGSINIGGFSYFNGGLDEIRLYNRALSATEIASLYKVGAAKVNSQPTLKLTGLDAGLIGYWTMDNQDINWTTNAVADKSGNNNIGTLAAFTSAASVAGKSGQTLKFDGSSNYIINNQTINIAKSTVSAWVYLPGYPTSGSLALVTGFAQGNNSDTHDKDLFIDSNGKAYYYTYTGQLKCTTEPALAIPKNSWHLLTGTNDGVNNYLYIDGVSVGSVAAGNSYTGYGSADILIGGKVNYSGSIGCGSGNTTRSYLPSNTKIDDVRVYNRALTGTEVKQLYNQSAGTKIEANPVIKPLTLDSGLVGYWTMNNQDINWATKKITDKSGSGNTGTLITMTATSSPVAGKIGQALKLNGLNSTLFVGSTSSLRYTGGDMTIATWFFIDKNETTTGDLISKPWNGCGEYNYRIVKGAGRTFSIALTGATGYGSSGSIHAITSNKWHHLVLRLTSAKKVQVYIDNFLEIDSTHGITNWVAPSCGDGNVPLDLGSLYPYGEGWVGNTGYSFGGAIDDTRIYNRALSDAEIKQLYNQGK